MAIAYRSFSHASIGTAGSSVDIPKPTGAVATDFVIVTLEFLAASPGTVSPPDETWSAILRSSSPYHYHYIKKLDGNETWPLTFQWTGSLLMAAWATAISGAVAVDGVGTISGYTSANATVVIPSISPANAGDQLFTFVGECSNGGTPSLGTVGSISGETSCFSDAQTVSANNLRRLAVKTETLTNAGATGTRSCTISSQTGNTCVSSGFMVAFTDQETTAVRKETRLERGILRGIGRGIGR